jgi:hypothetical protein
LAGDEAAGKAAVAALEAHEDVMLGPADSKERQTLWWRCCAASTSPNERKD